MEKYLCVHGHFYQPPRENPWLEVIEIQDSAHPYHDWNERINAECYASNSASRILDGDGRIVDIVSNYTKISFNFGPTLLDWMKTFTPEVYQAILDADRQSIKFRSGHGNAMAQAYNHIIMPLANSRDKRTQVIWGIKDFRHRFGRAPEGMWLPETAVDIESLDILSEHGIKFTILAQHQALRLREIGSEEWKEVNGGKIDPARAYLCNLPSGRKINLFFYDGQISQAVAFEKLLNKGEEFAHRFLSGFSDQRDWPQILNIATDGESYGHHHKFGDMALAYALNYIESNKLAVLTNYGEFLEKHPPTHEVEIIENTSWSCIHGVERWKNNCGCNSGGHPGWNQEWRRPLRDALDWLSEQISVKYENRAMGYLKDPWKARDDYIDVILSRKEDALNKFFNEHALRELSNDERIIVLKLLEIQKHAMYMYTSCGWFFDEMSGIETVQIIQYACHAIQLYEEIFADKIEKAFLKMLSLAKSNIPEHRDGGHIYEKFVRGVMIDLKKVGVHYAVSSLFWDYPEKADIYCYTIEREDYQKREAGRMMLAVGRLCITSHITHDKERISFGVIYFGDHSLNGGMRAFLGDEAYIPMKDEIIKSFEGGNFADIIRLMDKHFGMHNYSLKDLFRDEQRRILNIILGATLEEFETSYSQMYYNYRILMGFLKESNIPIPKAFYSAAEFTLGHDLLKALEEDIDIEKIKGIFMEIKKWEVSIDSVNAEYISYKRVEKMIEEVYKNPSDMNLMDKIGKIIYGLNSLPFGINYWHAQNIYYKMAKTIYGEFLSSAKSGNSEALRWIEGFRNIGEGMFFNVGSVLPKK